MLGVINGDLVKLALLGRFDAIVHGCNCFCTMGAGLAKQIKARFPEAYEVDRATVKGDRSKLGSYTAAYSNGVLVINAYTQFDYRGSGLRADYDAIRTSMERIASDHGNLRIGLPQIGAGLAKGNWAMILTILTEVFADVEATVVYFQPQND